jgi:hypothetical protein
MADGIRTLSLSDLDWYRTHYKEQKNLHSLINTIVSIQEKSFETIELNLSLLNWKLYLLTPSNVSATAQTYAFTSQTALILAIIIFAFMGIPLLIRLFE